MFSKCFWILCLIIEAFMYCGNFTIVNPFLANSYIWVNEDGICVMLPILLPVTGSTDLKKWVIGDCFYVLMVPMEGLINTHSTENSCSYPTEDWKTWLLSRLYCLCFVFLIYSLKGYFCSLHMTNNIPCGKKELDKGSRNASFIYHTFLFFFFLEVGV